jgi:hypothetical protein
MKWPRVMTGPPQRTSKIVPLLKGLRLSQITGSGGVVVAGAPAGGLYGLYMGVFIEKSWPRELARVAPPRQGSFARDNPDV